ncbi:hypothetical protein EDC94DRAFT_620998 [Helicostylum pulchrum]|nr:hypothetical protein EDC94DRAFT_620998 [Helicostylum pulchrum]
MPYIIYILLSFALSVKADLLQESAATIASDQQQQQQLVQIFTSLLGAIKLSFSFFHSFFYFIYKCITTLLSPIMWITTNAWSNFVTKPFQLFLHLAHILYPVTLFCVAAVCCGLFIGGCAGFAAEACSSLLISATWGPQPKKVSVQEDEDEDEEEEEMEENEEGEEERVMLNDNESTIHNTTGSISSFFGQRKREKEPLLQKPKVEQWRDSIDTSPVLIRRRKLSSDKKNGWDWDEDEEDEFCK